MKTITETNVLNLFNPHTALITDYGKSFGEKAALLFEKAIEEADKGLVYSAIDTARDALMMSKYSEQYLESYIHGFIAQLLFETGRPGAAAFHCEMAMSKLNPENKDFLEDRRYYNSLLSTFKRKAA